MHQPAVNETNENTSEEINLLRGGNVVSSLAGALGTALRETRLTALVSDGQTVITGSFNFTNAAEEKNAENLLVVQDADMAANYAQNWNVHQRHSEAYTGLAADVEQSTSRSRKRQ